MSLNWLNILIVIELALLAYLLSPWLLVVALGFAMLNGIVEGIDYLWRRATHRNCYRKYVL